jgi:hypothetical protein
MLLERAEAAFQRIESPFRRLRRVAIARARESTALRRDKIALVSAISRRISASCFSASARSMSAVEHWRDEAVL